MSELGSIISQNSSNIAAARAAAIQGNIKNTQPDKYDVAAKEFEAVYISQMLTPMFDGLETDGMFGGGSAENIYRSMMIDEYGKMIAQNGGIGLADSVKAQMIEMQSQQQAGQGVIK